MQQLSPAANGGVARSRGRILDPIERLSEILFGLIMALTFTGSIHAATAGHEEIRTMLVGAIGCNIAWGIVDAVMYLMTELVTRGRTTRILEQIRKSTAEQGEALLVDALPDDVAEAMNAREVTHVRTWLSQLPDPKERPHLTSHSWLGALGVFLLVTLSTFPLTVPFFFVSDATLGLRLSHAIALTLLFVIGFAFGRYARLPAILMGLAMLAIGVVLVLLTIALGG